MKVLVVGQGIAGSVLAHTLTDYDCAISIIDNGHKSSSSTVASGIYSPMVLKRLVKSWEIDTVLPFAEKFYQNLEKKLECKLLETVANYRRIAQESEQSDWIKKSADPEFQKYLKGTIEASQISENINAKLGYGKLEGSGKIDIATLLQKTKDHFQSRLKIEEINYDFIKIKDSGFIYDQEYFDKIIFCEGYKVTKNPFFPNLKLKPVKGENLLLHVPNLNLEKVVKSNIYILPIGKDHYHIGSTYKWDDLNELPTEEAKIQLLEKFEKLVDLPYKVIQQKAGVRPSSHDRRPILGSCATNSNLYAFNGLGAKGLLLSPYFANHICEFIFNKKPLLSDVDIKRFQVAEN